MSHSAKVRVGDKKGRTAVLLCGECSRETVHEVMVFVDSEDESDDGDIRVWDSYLTVQCRGCRSISFCVESSCTEDFDPEDPEILLVRKTLFPNRIVGRTPLRGLHHLPHVLSKVYEETRAALIQNLAVLSGIGIRAIVETVCNEKRAPGGNLSEKIDGLVSLTLITRAEAEILDDLRFMGNEAAHKVKTHTQEELNLAFDVVEHLLATVYILPERTKRLPKRDKA